MIISIVILNYNGMKNDYLPRCLYSLKRQTYQRLQIIVVDNSSEDGSLNYVEQTFPDVLLVRNDTNLGYCRGNNSSFEHVKGKYVLFANNDTTFSPDCMEQLLAGIHLAPDIGMIAPKLVRPGQKDLPAKVIDSAGLLLRLDLTLRDRGFGRPDSGQYEEPTYLFAPCGAAAFFRREVLDNELHTCGEIWDEDFEAYYEDGDLAWRIRNKGWRCLYYPSAVAEHHRGGTSAAAFFRKPPEYKVHTIKNRYLMIAKNAHLSSLVLRLPFIIGRELLIWGYLCLHPRLLNRLQRELRRTLPRAFNKRRRLGPKMRANVFKQEPALRP